MAECAQVRGVPLLRRLCEERSDVAIQSHTQRPMFVTLDCHASLAMTKVFIYKFLKVFSQMHQALVAKRSHARLSLG